MNEKMLRLFIDDNLKRIISGKDVKDKKCEPYICPRTGKPFDSRPSFWKFVRPHLKPKLMKSYDISVNLEKEEYEENLDKLFHKCDIEYLYKEYFKGRNITEKKLENLIGLIDLELLIILVKIWKNEATFEDYINDNENGEVESVSDEDKEEVKSVEEEKEDEDKEDKIVYNFCLGDCLEELKNIKDKTIDIVVTSPPYNIGLKYHKYKDKKPREQYLEWIYDIFVELKRVLKDTGHIFLNMGYTNRDPWISMEVALKLKDLLVLQNNITWVKSISIGEDKDDTHGHFKPINSDRYINVTNEDIYHFTKTDKVKINREAVGVPYKWECNLIDRKTGEHRIDKKTGLPVENKRCKGNSWFIPYDTIWNKSQKGFHPATFPEGLVEHCIKITDVKEGVILDPFIGSGTTVRAAKKMNDNIEGYNLSGIGFDIDEKYIEYCNTSIVD